MYRKSKLLVALTLALVIGLTGIIPALANDDDAYQTSEAAITKFLVTPYGTEIPEMTFAFTVTAKSFNGYETVEYINLAAAAIVSSNVTITFDGTQDHSIDENGVTTWYRESPSLFDATKYESPGAYEYEIAEKPDTYIIVNAKAEAITYSAAKYTVIVYVVQKDDGGYEIKYIGVTQTQNDTGGDPDTTKKLDPTPGGGDGKDHSEMVFTNNYMRTKTPVGPGDDLDHDNPNHATLFINKEIEGEFASTTQEFEFDLTITVPYLVPGYVKNEYEARIVNVAENGALSYADNVIHKFVNGASKSFQLMANQRLVFVDTPVGTKYTVSETGVPGYKINADVFYSSNLTAKVSAINAGDSLTLPGGPVTSDLMFVSEVGSSVAFLNDASGTTPTGIIMNNLPFIGLIALALCGLIIFVIIKTRKSEDNA